MLKTDIRALNDNLQLEDFTKIFSKKSPKNTWKLIRKVDNFRNRKHRRMNKAIHDFSFLLISQKVFKEIMESVNIPLIKPQLKHFFSFVMTLMLYTWRYLGEASVLRKYLNEIIRSIKRDECRKNVKKGCWKKINKYRNDVMHYYTSSNVMSGVIP